MPARLARGIRAHQGIIAAAAGVPVIAIGGIAPEHAPLLRGAGAHGFAVIRGIWGADDAAAAAARYLSAYDDASRTGTS